MNDPLVSWTRLRRMLYENSLSLVFLGLCVLALVGQSLTGHHQHNEEQQAHGQPSVTHSQYLRTGHFWEAVTENWESEFLQMGVYVLLTAFLRQKRSPESKFWQARRRSIAIRSMSTRTQTPPGPYGTVGSSSCCMPIP